MRTSRNTIRAAALVAAATSLTATGCVKTKPPPPEALDKARALVSSGLSKCSRAGGGPSTQKLVEDGAKLDGHAVSVSCKVARQGLAFVVDAKIAVAGVGKLTFTSPIDAKGRSKAADATLEREGMGTWTSDRCTLEPASLEPGRYAAELTCQEAKHPSADPCELWATVKLDGCEAM